EPRREPRHHTQRSQEVQDTQVASTGDLRFEASFGGLDEGRVAPIHDPLEVEIEEVERIHALGSAGLVLRRHSYGTGAPLRVRRGRLSLHCGLLPKGPQGDRRRRDVPELTPDLPSRWFNT